MKLRMKSKLKDVFKETAAKSIHEERDWIEAFLKEDTRPIKGNGLKISNLLESNGVPQAEAQETVQTIKNIQNKYNGKKQESLIIDMAQGALISAGISKIESKLIADKIVNIAKSINNLRLTPKM